MPNIQPPLPPRKLDAVLAEMRAGNWPTAILLAAKFQDLGAEKAAILRGREAVLRPAFQRQIKRDPAVLIAQAREALERRYGGR